MSGKDTVALVHERDVGLTLWIEYPILWPHRF